MKLLLIQMQAQLLRAKLHLDYIKIGILVSGATAASTITAVGDVENLKFTKVIKVCGRANTTLTVASVPSVPNFADLTAVGVDTETPIIANANLIIKKIA